MIGCPHLEPTDVISRTGAGIAILCEGRSTTLDENFYNQWFGSRALDATFFGVGGTSEVTNCVSALRGEGIQVPVFGLLDRDFADDSEIGYQQNPSFGEEIYRTNRYTLENYLLDPSGWLQVVYAFTSLSPTTRVGWNSVDEVRARIADYYQVALPASAHNWTVKLLSESFHGSTGFRNRNYYSSVAALQNQDPEDALIEWAKNFNAEGQAQQTFQDRLQYLQNLNELEDLEKYISGKLVINQLYAEMPLGIASGRPELRAVLAIYLHEQPVPPPDLITLLDCIVLAGSIERYPGPTAP